MIALVHHHLRRGGVTRVMYSHARILRDAGERVVIYSGEPAPDPPPEDVELRVVPELAYNKTAPPATVQKLVSGFRALGEDAVLHVHNHSLGKNPAVTAAAAELARAGMRMVLQIHDFAEDGRPVNLATLLQALPDPEQTLYPDAPRVQYAVLQPRDRGILLEAGLSPNRVTVLPNPVDAPEDLPPPADPPVQVLYLSRCIRRKNLGEFLLWAQVLGPDIRFATSLIPENPAERPLFDQWAALSEALKLPVHFGIGMAPGTRFAEVAGAADACITTSVGEGFGMSFLEPFLMNRPLLGRDLPAITAGFKADGLRLEGLYDRLPVPVDALDPDFWARALSAVRKARKQLGIPSPLRREDLQSAWVSEGQIDFGALDETAQIHLLRRSYRPALPLCTDAPLRHHNRTLLQTRYGPAPTLLRLQTLYAKTFAEAEAPRWLPPSKIRDAFSDLSQFRLLRA